jgi:hypothetical protein
MVSIPAEELEVARAIIAAPGASRVKLAAARLLRADVGRRLVGIACDDDGTDSEAFDALEAEHDDLELTILRLQLALAQDDARRALAHHQTTGDQQHA